MYSTTNNTISLYGQVQAWVWTVSWQLHLSSSCLVTKLLLQQSEIYFLRDKGLWRKSMKGTIGTVILFFSLCCVVSLPLHNIFKRNVTHQKRNSESDSVAHLLADYIFDSTASDARLVTHQDIVNFYKRVFEYDDYMADQISRRYIEWGDVNGDGALTKEELTIAIRNHYT